MYVLFLLFYLPIIYTTIKHTLTRRQQIKQHNRTYINKKTADKTTKIEHTITRRQQTKQHNRTYINKKTTNKTTQQNIH
jgi:hypothetical protein